MQLRLCDQHCQLCFFRCGLIPFAHLVHIRMLKMIFNNFQGAIESILIGEIKLSLRESLDKGFNIFSGDQKVQLFISDLEVYLRTSSQSIKKNKVNKPRSSRKLGRGTWVLLSHIARLLSLSVTEVNVKVCVYNSVTFCSYSHHTASIFFNE